MINPMETYETVLVFKPTYSDTEVAGLSDKIKQLIAANGGEILSHEIWGRRKLSFPINKVREGVYSYFKYKGAGQTLRKLEQNLSISEQLLRYMTIKMWERKPRPERKKKAPAKEASTTAAEA